jgi:hypothetical protein
MRKIESLLIGVGVAMMMGSGAHAGAIASGPFFTFGTGQVICHATQIYTAESLAVRIQIIDGNGALLGTTNCGAMALNDYCYAASPAIELNVTPSCVIRTSGSAGGLRGNMEIRMNGYTEKIVPLR